MITFKKATGLAALLVLGLSHANASEWTTDADAASTQAKEEGKLLVMNFTGSDWCHWCHKLKGEIFSQDEFQTYADENLVLLELDFPRKTPQTDELKQQNRALAKKYGVGGFPTVVVLNEVGEKVGELRYTKGGPKAFITQLEAIKATL